MDDGEALIRAIRAARDDDTPRLVYADWLDEHGDPARAEFVRLQCWLSAHPESHPKWEANWYREQELIRDHGLRWLAPLAGYFRYTTPEFNRGFVTSFYASDISEFVSVLPELIRVTATDRLKILRTSDEDVPVLGGYEAIEHIRELVTNADVHGLSEGGLAQLVRLPHLQDLRRLDLSGANLGHGNPDAALFAREAVLPALEHLHLGRRDAASTPISAGSSTSSARRTVDGSSAWRSCI